MPAFVQASWKRLWNRTVSVSKCSPLRIRALSRSFPNCRRSLPPRIQAWMHLSANILQLLCNFPHWSAMCSRIRVCVAKRKKKSKRFATTTRARRKSLIWRKVVRVCLMSVWMACRMRLTRPRRLITLPWNKEVRLTSSLQLQRASRTKHVLRSIRQRNRRNGRKALMMPQFVRSVSLLLR